MFHRAANEIYQLCGQIVKGSEDYVPVYEEEKFEETLKKQSDADYCLYILMKIFHFLDIIHGVRVLKMGGDFIKDDSNIMWLSNISRLQHETVPAKVRDENTVKGMNLIGFDAQHGRFNEEMTQACQNPRSRREIDDLTDDLYQHYETTKMNVGFNYTKASYQEELSNIVFTQIHPEAPSKLTNILQANYKRNHYRNTAEGSSNRSKNSSINGTNLRSQLADAYFSSSRQSLQEIKPNNGSNTLNRQNVAGGLRSKRLQNRGIFSENSEINDRSLPILSLPEISNQDINKISGSRKSSDNISKVRASSQPYLQKMLNQNSNLT